MHCQFHQLDGRQIAGLRVNVSRHRDLRQADGSRVGVLRGAEDLEGRDERVAHVRGALEVRVVGGTLVAEADVDVDHGCLVAREPARLEGEGAAGGRPVSAVLGCGHAAAWGRELLAGGELTEEYEATMVREETYMDTSIACRTGRTRW